MRWRLAALVFAAIIAVPIVALAQEAPASYPGQSNTVPVGFPTPETAFERLTPGGVARDPGPMLWARPGPYIAPNWSDFSLPSFKASDFLAATYYFYWHDLTNPDRAGRFQGRFHVPPDPA